jgi:hypothetical protein
MGRSFFRLLLLLPLIVAVTVTVGVVAPAAASARQGTPGGTSSASATGSTQAQCGRPVGERAGAWLCMVTPAVQAQAARAAAVGLPASGYCRISGCWYVSSVTNSEYSATGYFGYGDTRLGKVTLFFQVSLNGRQSGSKPVRFESTIGVRDLVIEGNRLYYDSKWPAGHPVSPSVFAHHSSGNVAGGELAQWAPNGYKAYPPPVYVGSVWHQWSWQMADYPGTWYFYATSVLIYRINQGSIYHFGSDEELGQNPAGSGWNG